HVSRAKIGFAGTKDGRSVATQLMSFDAPIEAVTSLTIPDVTVSDAYRARRMIQIGDLIGNKFRIRVADLDPAVDAAESCRLVRERLDAAGGYPNFFGTQRFGSVRPITHLIGRDMVKGDLQGAVMKYVANPLDEDSDANDARRTLQETGDFERAFREFPQKLTFERMLIGHLKDHPGDHVGALRTLPRNLLMMFVHAYQSYLFNRMLSQRIREGLPLGVPVVGDLVLPLTKTGVPDHDTPIPVTEDNLEKATRNCREGKAFVSGLIYGSDSVFSDGRIGEIERAMVEAEGLKGSDFEIATFSFSLNKGCYATGLLREFMKAEISSY
ncbi:MAG: tRNA pseudouridine(13) synthase TruD, partial [Thermoplasmata archaeon]|nr:tRNA pseudouridine(13) synthase TruD [Thermoplasmata archaeon]